MFISTGSVSDTSFLRGIIASANGARGESFIPFRRFLPTSEKKENTCVHIFLLPSFPTHSLSAAEKKRTSLALPVWRTPLAETSSSDDGDPRPWLDDWYLLYVITVIRLSACQFWKPKGSKKLIVCSCSEERQKSYLQENKAIRIFCQCIGEVVSLIIKSDNSERLPYFSNIHNSCFKRHTKKCKRKCCSALLSNFPGLLVLTSSLEQLLCSPFHLCCVLCKLRREDGSYHPTVMNSGDLLGCDKPTQ